MMTSEEAKNLLNPRTFVPFRLHMTDGRSFDILHPDFVWILRNRLDIAIVTDGTNGIVDHVERCFYLHVVRVEELQERVLG